MNNELSTTRTTSDIEEILKALSMQLGVNEKIQTSLKQTEDKVHEMSTVVETISARTDKLENETTITHAQANKIHNFGSVRVHELLGSNDSLDYVKYSRTFYGHLWHDFKKRFALPSYTDLRKVDYDVAIEFIEAWFPEGGTNALKAEVDRINAIRAAA